MKKLTQSEVDLLFATNECKLLGEYEGCTKSMSYRCKCSNTGKISLDKFKRRLQRGEGCQFCHSHKWLPEEDKILCELYGKTPRQKILEKLPGINHEMMKARVIFLRLKGNRSLVQSQARKGKGRRYSFNHEYFNVIDEVKSYWAGFIAADGCVSKKRQQLTIRLSKKDLDHLKKFQKIIEHTGKIYEVPARCDNKIKSGPQVILPLYGADKLLQSLEKNYNIVPRKSLVLEAPSHLDEINSLAFIVGYIDGDGCISSNNNRIQLIGTKSMMEWIKKWFDEWEYVSKKIANIRANKKQFTYSVSGKRGGRLIEKMLSINLPRLERKWNFNKGKLWGK